MLAALYAIFLVFGLVGTCSAIVPLAVVGIGGMAVLLGYAIIKRPPELHQAR